MRNFQTNKNILGMMLVSRCRNILRITIPEIFRWCDNLLIFYDNEDDETVKIVDEYKELYPSRIRTAHSTRSNVTQFDKEKGDLFVRFNKIQPLIRNEALEVVKGYMKDGEKIDLVIFMDSDECLTNTAEEMINFLINREDKKAIIIRPFFTFGDDKTVINFQQNAHMRIFKPSEELTFLPYHGLGKINPIKKSEIQMFRYAYVHHAYLTEEKRKWRTDNWKSAINKWESYIKRPLWEIKKNSVEMTENDILELFKRKHDFTVDDYLKEHELSF